jgi:Amt family ammonium transporter
MACVGGALLYMGWFGFNAGSALTSTGLASLVVANTHVGASASAVVWLVLSGLRHKTNVIEIMNGAIAGLAGITPAAGFISTPGALLLGGILGLSR